MSLSKCYSKGLALPSNVTCIDSKPVDDPEKGKGIQCIHFMSLRKDEALKKADALDSTAHKILAQNNVEVATPIASDAGAIRTFFS